MKRTDEPLDKPGLYRLADRDFLSDHEPREEPRIPLDSDLSGLDPLALDPAAELDALTLLGGLEDDELEQLAEEARAILGRDCPHCGSNFVPKSPKAVYCSTSCRVLAWQKRTGYR
jgi:hypothetical protein